MGYENLCQVVNTMKHEEFFRKHPVFTGEELDRHLSAIGKTGRRTRESLLNYHRKTGHVIRIRRGLFAVIPTGADPNSYPVDPVLVAVKLTRDAILSHQQFPSTSETQQ